MMASTKRNFDDTDSVSPLNPNLAQNQRKLDRPLKKQKSISDEIAPIFCQINVGSSSPSLDDICKNSQQTNNHATNTSKTDLGSATEVDNFDLEPDATKNSPNTALNQTQNDNNGEHGNSTDIDGKVTQFVSDNMTSFFDCLNSKIHHGYEHFLDQSDSVEEEEAPGNNVYLQHPTQGKGYMIPLGMHIARNEGNVEGHKVLMIEEGNLAAKLQLRKNDVLIAVEDTCIEKSSIIEVIELFGSLSATFSITILRQETNEEGIKEFQCITLTVEISTDGNDVISVTIIDVRKANQIYSYSHTKDKVIISQKTGPEDVTRFLKTDNKSVTMETQFVQGKCHFAMNIYHGVVQETAHVCTICNVTNTQSLTAAKTNVEDNFRISLASAKDLTKDKEKLQSDNRFFYIHSTGINEQAFESIQHEDHYLTFEDGIVKVKLQNVKSPKHLPSEFRFLICEDCIH